MKIVIYTIPDCKFSQQEKQFLTEKGIVYEEKDLMSNRDYLTEMLQVGQNFAGTPLTQITKDDGKILVIKGFSREEFEKALGLPPSTTDVSGNTTTQSVTTASATASPTQAPQQPVSNAMPPTDMTMPPQNPPTPMTPPATSQAMQQPTMSTMPPADVNPAMQNAQPVMPPAGMTPEETQNAINRALENMQSTQTPAQAPMTPQPIASSVMTDPNAQAGQVAPQSPTQPMQ